MSDQPDWLTLDGDESVVWTGRPRTRSILGEVFGALVVLVVAIAAGWYLATRGLPVPATLPSWAPVAIVAGGVLWAALQAGSAYLRIANTDYVLTTQSIYKKTGIASENVTRIGVDRVQRTSLSKDFFGNLFDYGDVAISTAGGSGVEMTITEIDDPGTFRNLLREQVSRASQRAGDGDTGRRRASDESVRRALEEARKLRRAAEGIEEVLSG